MRNLSLLRPGDSVLVKLDKEKWWRTPATVMGQSATECSYMISSLGGGMKRRNRSHLQLSPSESSVDAETTWHSGTKYDDDIVRRNNLQPTQTSEGWRVE